MRNEIDNFIRQTVTCYVAAKARLYNLRNSKAVKLGLSSPKTEDIYTVRGRMEAYDCVIKMLIAEGLATEEYIKNIKEEIKEQLGGK